MKIALVTGGSRGIGRAICVKLARMGYYVIVNYVGNTGEAEKTLEEVRQEGTDGELMRFDVSDIRQVASILGTWMELHPDEYIEVLVNNAGICKDNLMVFMPEEEWKVVLDISLNGFYNVTQTLLQPMLTRRFGRIINMASVSGLKGTIGQVNYSAAKGGIIAATKALAQEVASKNVTVNAVAPGFIKTDMLVGLNETDLKQMIPVRRLGTPEEVAHLVGFLASEEAAYITGDVISINGGLYT